MKRLSKSGSLSRADAVISMQYALIQALYWAANCSFYAYLTVFLQHRGYSPSQIGYATSVRIIATMVGQLVLAFIADRYRRIPLKYIVGGLMGTAVIASLFLQFTTPAYAGMLVLLFVLGFTEIGVSILIDMLGIQFMNAGSSLSFTACRSCGSVSYAFVAVIMGRVIDARSVEVTVHVHTVLLILTVAMVFIFRRCRAAEEEEATSGESSTMRGALVSLLRDHPQYRMLLIANAVLCFGYWPINSFMPVLMEEVGGNNTLLGIALFVGPFAEMPMLAFIFPRLKRNHSMPKLLVVSMVCHVLRWAFYIVVTTPFGVIFQQCFSMFSFALSYAAEVQYINENIPVENRVKGQSFYSIAGNLGGTFGYSVFGNVLQQTNIRVMNAAGTVFVAIALGLMVIMTRLPAVRKREA